LGTLPVLAMAGSDQDSEVVGAQPAAVADVAGKKGWLLGRLTGVVRLGWVIGAVVRTGGDVT